jgi:hypothetical protein
MDTATVAKKQRGPTFADIVREPTYSELTPAPGRRVPFEGAVDQAGVFRDLDGHTLELASEEITTADAQELLQAGAQVAYEECGCGGGYGCQPIWVVGEDLAALRSGPAPRQVRTYGAPTWFDVWSNTDVTVVFAHGDIEWGSAI